MKFKFDDNLDYQTGAVKSIVDLFIDFGDFSAYFDEADSEIKGNIPEDEELEEEWLLENLQAVQEEFNEQMDANSTPTMKITPSSHLQVESGIMLEGVSNDGFQYPSFSIEMETGTGKTYVYLKTLYELYQKYDFKKFIIVVPSIAIFQGVREAFDSTRDHFKSIYGNDIFALRPYEGGKIDTIKFDITSFQIFYSNIRIYEFFFLLFSHITYIGFCFLSEFLKPSIVNDCVLPITSKPSASTSGINKTTKFWRYEIKRVLFDVFDLRAFHLAFKAHGCLDSE